MISIGKSRYDPITHELVGPEKKKRKLAPDIHLLLMCLQETPNVMVPKEKLIMISGDKNQLYVYISRLRRILEVVGGNLSIETRYGKGYVLNY